MMFFVCTGFKYIVDSYFALLWDPVHIIPFIIKKNVKLFSVLFV